MKTLLRFILILTLALFAGNKLSAQYADFIYSNNYNCAPMTVDFTNTSYTVGLQGNIYWDWYIEGHGNFSTFEPPQIIFNEGTHNVILTMSDDSGFVSTFPMIFEAYPGGDTFFPENNVTLCPGDPINFYTNVADAWSIVWDFGDGSLIRRGDFDIQYIQHTYADPGSYDVTLIVDHSCGPDTIVQTVNIDAAAIPVVYANIEGDLEKAETFGADILKLCVEVGGVLSGEHGIGIEKRDLMGVMFNETDLQQQQRLKCAFDGNGLLNPGKVFPTLHRCAEMGWMKVKAGNLPFPDIPRF